MCLSSPTDPAWPVRLAQTAQAAIEFHPHVEIVSEEALPATAPPIEDSRTWE